MKPAVKGEDTIILAPLNQINPFWYYYKYDQKDRLKNIDRHGKRVDNRWQSFFLDNLNFSFRV